MVNNDTVYFDFMLSATSAEDLKAALTEVHLRPELVTLRNATHMTLRLASGLTPDRPDVVNGWRVFDAYAEKVKKELGLEGESQGG